MSSPFQRQPPSSRPASRPKTLAEARKLITSIYPCMAGDEVVPVGQSVGRCLAEDIIATVDLPRFDAAAMDGYAILSSDLDADGSATLSVVAEIAAGHPSDRALKPGQAARIFTGAPLPAGADRVVVQENSRPTRRGIALQAPPGGKPHVRMRGEDVEAGRAVLKAGVTVGAGQLALLTALGIAEVTVRRRLRVALLSTGDELGNGGALRPGQIVDSNRPMLRAWLERLGCEVHDLGIVPDDAETLLARLIATATEADLIVSSGGASVGPADHLASLISKRGFLEFWQLAMRPGKPVGLGDIDDCPILALPGNPMAAAVTFTLIGRFLIARLSGIAAPASLHLPLASAVSGGWGRLDVLAARLVRIGDGGSVVAPLKIQGSASLGALAAAEGFVLLPPERADFDAGDVVEYVPI